MYSSIGLENKTPCCTKSRRFHHIV